MQLLRARLTFQHGITAWARADGSWETREDFGVEQHSQEIISHVVAMCHRVKKTWWVVTLQIQFTNQIDPQVLALRVLPQLIKVDSEFPLQAPAHVRSER